MTKDPSTGKVILAGAGPGDPELITLKTLRYLQRADVVVADRLVSDVILQEYVNPQAEIIHVGKQCRKGASTPQSAINEILVEQAQQGKLVVRLKGGDVSVFSNVLDELRTLVQNRIAYEIIPGITAALGAAAYSGIPLTARGHATAVRLLTFYKNGLLDDAYWQELAATGDTLVFYMSSDTLDLLVDKLLAHGIGADKYLAVIEQATTPVQNVYHCNIYDYKTRLGGRAYVSPTIIIIGKVATLHAAFGWLPNSNRSDYYFKPVAKDGQPVTEAARGEKDEIERILKEIGIIEHSR